MPENLRRLYKKTMDNYKKEIALAVSFLFLHILIITVKRQALHHKKYFKMRGL